MTISYFCNDCRKEFIGDEYTFSCVYCSSKDIEESEPKFAI
jgi:DNA-directed RNA polymerase subunit RPC12/RpoP